MYNKRDASLGYDEAPLAPLLKFEPKLKWDGMEWNKRGY